MRTTVVLDDDIADFLTEQARLLSVPFRQVVNETLRRGMSTAAGTERPPFRVSPFHSEFQPGVDPLRLNQLNADLEDAEILERQGQ